LAKILRVYSNKEVVEILKETITSMDDSAMWLVREGESARSELLIDESGSWLD
jgi:hypothetical protein